MIMIFPLLLISRLYLQERKSWHDNHQGMRPSDQHWNLLKGKGYWKFAFRTLHLHFCDEFALLNAHPCYVQKVKRNPSWHFSTTLNRRTAGNLKWYFISSGDYLMANRYNEHINSFQTGGEWWSSAIFRRPEASRKWISSSSSETFVYFQWQILIYGRKFPAH